MYLLHRINGLKQNVKRDGLCSACMNNGSLEIVFFGTGDRGESDISREEYGNLRSIMNAMLKIWNPPFCVWINDRMKYEETIALNDKNQYF